MSKIKFTDAAKDALAVRRYLARPVIEWRWPRADLIAPDAYSAADLAWFRHSL